jgi:hypothetical protein
VIDFPVAGIRSSTRGYTGATSQVETLKVKPMMRIGPAMAAAAALICFDIPASHAQYFGDAPWCAVVQYGNGGIHWDCEYNTVEACVPNVLAGNRGFCGQNPYYRPALAPETYRVHHPRYQTHKHHKH